MALMTSDEPPTEELRRRQLATEAAERREQERADEAAEADTHRRRADKAGYLRHKLEEQQRADDGD